MEPISGRFPAAAPERPRWWLVVAMGLEAGVPAATLAALVGAQESLLDEPVRLAARFARAVLARDPAADALREELVHRFGPRGIISLGFAITAARIYPTLKYALGHGASCQRVVVAGKPIAVVRQAEPGLGARHVAAMAES